ncbi:hypothetical protein [Candidatus Ichthyocystis hellenicum]|uniref:hypothetical protein n=1 Tax=Candidatus Ichthyocystis hellenicum TaxID=1561003 RepID=UPI0011125313|nr:hypothetical protein [Candidatus Ichthyocystis hellenicum]
MLMCSLSETVRRTSGNLDEKEDLLHNQYQKDKQKRPSHPLHPTENLKEDAPSLGGQEDG